MGGNHIFSDSLVVSPVVSPMMPWMTVMIMVMSIIWMMVISWMICYRMIWIMAVTISMSISWVIMMKIWRHLSTNPFSLFHYNIMVCKLAGMEPISPKNRQIPNYEHFKNHLIECEKRSPGDDKVVLWLDVNTKKHRLTLLDGNKVIKRYRVAIGKMLTPTPTGSYTIINKEKNPGGPFGAFWMGLSKPHYGIHGTNNPSSIGKNVSHGCIRMYNNDVLELANIVPIGTNVYIHD